VLVEHGADPKLGNTSDGLNSLMVAAGLDWTEKIRGNEAEALETVKWLVDRGLDVNAATKTGDTALHGAAYRGANSIVTYLIEKGAKVNAANSAGLTPLDIALNKDAREGKPGIIRESTATLLREKGGKPGERKAGAISNDEDEK
jgi:ankyrin repeat protein